MKPSWMKWHALIVGAGLSLLGFGAFAEAPPADRPTERRIPVDDRPTYVSPDARDESVSRRAKDTIDRTTEKDRRETERDRPSSWIGIAFMLGGGAGSFFDPNLNAATSTTGMWQVRAVVGSRRHFAGEMAYVGGTESVHTLGVTDGAQMMNNGFEGAFRYNLLTGLVQPYAISGVGYSHYSIADTQVTSDVQGYGDAMTFPMGTGVAFKPGPFTIDGRITFRPATSSGLLRRTNLSSWDIGAHAGFEF
jgi:hypothetical protein